jgi:hypothetical protein
MRQLMQLAALSTRQLLIVNGGRLCGGSGAGTVTLRRFGHFVDFLVI